MMGCNGRKTSTLPETNKEPENCWLEITFWDLILSHVTKTCKNRVKTVSVGGSFLGLKIYLYI